MGKTTLFNNIGEKHHIFFDRDIFSEVNFLTAIYEGKNIYKIKLILPPGFQLLI